MTKRSAAMQHQSPERQRAGAISFSVIPNLIGNPDSRGSLSRALTRGGNDFYRCRFVSFLCLLILISALMAVPVQAYYVELTHSPLYVAPGDQIEPRISGHKVIFTDFSGFYGDIYVLDEPSGSFFNLTNTPLADERLNDINGDLIAFTRFESVQNGDIYVYDITDPPASPPVATIATESDERRPRIDGDYVVYERHGPDVDVLGYHIPTQTTFPIATGPGDQHRPAVSYDKVVYQDAATNTIKLYRINSGASWTLDTGEDPDIDGEIIAYSKDVGGGNFDIYMLDLIQGGNPVAIAARPGQQVRPSIAGHMIGYDDDATGDWNVLVYLIEEELEIQVTVASSADQLLNNVGENFQVVYEDDRAGDLDLWITDIALIPSSPCAWGLVVDDDGPNDPGPGDPTVSDPLEDGSRYHPYDSIQEAIDTGSNGIAVSTGIYTGIGNKNIVVDRPILFNPIDDCQEDRWSNPIIDCENDGRGFHISADARLSRFTIRNGNADYGGGIYVAQGNPTIESCSFVNNTATAGGGIYVAGGQPKFLGCVLEGNTAQFGGAIACEQASPRIGSCKIRGNTASSDGGGIHCSGAGQPLIESCLVADNTAAGNGGGFYCTGTSNTPDVRNCTLAGNTAASGNGLYADLNSQPVLANCILWHGGGEIVAAGGAVVTATHSDIYGGFPGTANINIDPRFADSDGPDDNPATWADNDYHLHPASPCVNRGSNTFTILFSDVTTANGGSSWFKVADNSRYSIGDEIEYDDDSKLRSISWISWWDSTTIYISYNDRLSWPAQFLAGKTILNYGWGDIDGHDRILLGQVDMGVDESLTTEDGDLDLALAGNIGSQSRVSKIYRNDGGGTFTDITASLTAVHGCSLAWGDYDNDGDLDLALAGDTGATQVSIIYRNDGSDTFTDITAGLAGVRNCALAWGDYDNDGDLDLALAGHDGSGRVSKIYRNDGSDTFFDIGASLVGVSYYCALAWADYDKDGDLDLAIAGEPSDLNGSCAVYRNDGADTFTDINAGLIEVRDCSLAWGDYDNDGFLDLAVAGTTNIGSGRTSKIYHNDGGSGFSDISASLTEVRSCALAWADYDNDGDLDLALTGYAGSATRVSEVYRNEGGGTFTDIGAGLTGVEYCSLAWGDYDQDGDLDLALAGNDGSNPVTKLYRNACGIYNTPPQAPGGLSTLLAGTSATFNWNAASDDQTPTDGLCYNLRVGTTEGDDDVFCGMADLSSGLRRLPDMGNAQKRLSWTIGGLNPGDMYYWSVQAIDTGFAGSAWAEEHPTAWFTEINTGLPQISSSAVAWGDYDNDGDLDLALAGADTGGRLSAIYRNDGSDGGTGWIYTDILAGLTGVSKPSLAWGDYDNDGDLDLTLTGYTGGTRVSEIYNNNGGVFTDIVAGLIGVNGASVAWGDYDNDGDLDLALAGVTGSSSRASRIYRNDDGIFTDSSAGLTDVGSCSLAWGDYDQDGDLDLALAGFDSLTTQVSKIYNNHAGTFTDIGAGLTGVNRCSLAWGDYDNDGDLDLALSGNDGVSEVSKIYRNDGDDGLGGWVFTEIAAGLIGVYSGELAWGDYDNDGDLDLAVMGFEGVTRVSKVYRNDAGTFADITTSLTGVNDGSLAWGDFDNDGDLDLIQTGYDGSNRVATLYQNNNELPNTEPIAPTGLYAVT
ncbi:MAG: FG-GAP-like repeat-containing protein, partial [Planctomycetota bacterium]